MKTKVVYVLTSTEKDIYLEQTLVSIYSLRKYNPQVHVTLLTDTLTEKTLRYGNRIQILEFVDELIVINFPESLSGKIRSRYLKTNIRNYMDGDYLYLDSDTIVYADLSSIDDCVYNIAAVLDCHGALSENPYLGMIREHAKAVNNNLIKQDNYFNSGVMYVKDNNITRDFYKKWNATYNLSKDKVSCMDQPSFNKVNSDFNIVKEIDGIWNCQLKHGFRFFRNVKIFHILTTNKHKDGDYLHLFQLDDFYMKLKNKDMNLSYLDKYVENLDVGWNVSVSEVIVGSDLKNMSKKEMVLTSEILESNSYIIKSIFKILILV